MKIRILLSIFFLILASIACCGQCGDQTTPAVRPTLTAIPTNTPIPAASLDANGISVSYPKSWTAKNLQDVSIFIVSDEALLAGSSSGSDGGMVLLMVKDEQGEPIETLPTLIGQFDLGTDAEEVESPTEVTINGQKAARAVLKGIATGDDVETYVLFAVIINHGRQVQFVAASPAYRETEFKSTFESILNSVTIEAAP